MNCRGNLTRVRIVNDYYVEPVAHLKLLNGQSKESDAGGKITDEYYIFKCTDKISKQTENIVCGSCAANHFFQLINKNKPPLFNPLINNQRHNGNNGNDGNNANIKWNDAMLQLHNAIMLIMVIWNIDQINGILLEIKNSTEKYYYKEPFESNIKSINTIIRNSFQGATLTDKINELRNNNNLRIYNFELLNVKLNNLGVQSYF
ncbi:MAG: hypothetical protein ACLUH5_05415 [Eubacterium sp.]